MSSRVFAAYEFVQKRAQERERERIKREVDALFRESGSDRVPVKDILRIVRGDGE